jgi:hypothetical protein
VDRVKERGRQITLLTLLFFPDRNHNKLYKICFQVNSLMSGQNRSNKSRQ